ncbi:MAG TPA: SDR family oxidoreductase [Micromonosporaceae bacterium]
MGMTRALNESTVVVTGASSGIGAATALSLAERDAAVVLAGRGESTLRAVAERCRQLGGRALVVPTEVADPIAVERLATRAVAEFGRIDAWINNAAVASVGLFDEIPVAEFRRIVEVDLLGVAYGMRAALPYLRTGGGGVLVNVASTLAEVSMPYQAAYTAAKHAVRGLSDTLRQELRITGDKGVAVCTLLPPAVDTPYYGHSANHTGRRLRPPPPIYPPETVAYRIVRLLQRPRREAYVTLTARLQAWQWRLAPGLTERALGRYAGRAQFVREPAPDSSGNLFQPTAAARIEGGWHGRRRALIRTRVIGFLAGSAIGAVVAVLRRRGFLVWGASPGTGYRARQRVGVRHAR